MKFEKHLFDCYLNGHGIAKYWDEKKVVLVHEHDGEEQARKVFDTDHAYIDALQSTLIRADDVAYNTGRALGAMLDRHFGTNMLDQGD